MHVDTEMAFFLEPVWHDKASGSVGRGEAGSREALLVLKLGQSPSSSLSFIHVTHHPAGNVCRREHVKAVLLEAYPNSVSPFRCPGRENDPRTYAPRYGKHRAGQGRAEENVGWFHQLCAMAASGCITTPAQEVGEAR